MTLSSEAFPTRDALVRQQALNLLRESGVDIGELNSVVFSAAMTEGRRCTHRFSQAEVGVNSRGAEKALVLALEMLGYRVHLIPGRDMMIYWD